MVCVRGLGRYLCPWMYSVLPIDETLAVLDKLEEDIHPDTMTIGRKEQSVLLPRSLLPVLEFPLAPHLAGFLFESCRQSFTLCLTVHVDRLFTQAPSRRLTISTRNL